MAAKKAQPSMASMMRAMRNAPMSQVQRMDQMLDNRLGPRDTDKTPNKTAAKKTRPRGK